MQISEGLWGVMYAPTSLFRQCLLPRGSTDINGLIYFDIIFNTDVSNNVYICQRYNTIHSPTRRSNNHAMTKSQCTYINHTPVDIQKRKMVLPAVTEI